jgi:enoyl-CoA hydratase/carnithine racemase
MESEEKIIFKSYNDNAYLEIILNNEAKLNAMDHSMAESCCRKLFYWVEDDIREENKDHFDLSSLTNKEEKMPKVVLLRGKGGKAFCAGGDVTQLHKQKMENKIEEIIEFYKYEIMSDTFFARLKPILISLWNGYVMGGGVGISINSPIRIATDNTVFAMPECTIGLYPDVGAAYFMTRIFNNNYHIGLYCAMTGHRVIGKDNAICGTATHYVKKDNLEKIQEILKEKITSGNEVINLNDIEQIIKPYVDYAFNSEGFSFENQDIIEKVFLFDNVVEIFNRLENMKATSEDTKEREFASKTLTCLSKLSPLSLLVIFEFAKRALKFNNILQAYKVDTLVFSKFANESEFYEGVRALLIDKDKKPKWQYETVYALDQEKLAKHYFGEIDI